MIGIWTSRLERNAIPIVNWIVSNLNSLNSSPIIDFDFVLTGESCDAEYSQTYSRNNIPTLIKSVNTLRNSLRENITSDAKVLFIDDNPDNLRLDLASWFIRFNTFDAYKTISFLRDNAIIKDKNMQHIWMDIVDKESNYVLSRKDMIIQWFTTVCNKMA